MEATRCFCEHWGEQISADARFCRFCGREQNGQAPPRAKRRRVVIAAITVAVCLAGGLTAFLLVREERTQRAGLPATRSEAPAARASASRTVKVPDLIGLSVVPARRELAELRLGVEVVRDFDSRPAGEIIGQRPAVGRSVGPGSRVRLVVSRGFDPLTKSSRLSTSGLGSVRVGMSVSRAEDVARIELARQGTGIEGCTYYQPEGLDGVAFMVVDGEVARVDISASSFPTLSGVRIGDSEDRVRSVYGSRIDVSRHEYVPAGHYLTFVPLDPDDRDHRMVFETDGSKVTQMRAGKLPEAEYIEGCA